MSKSKRPRKKFPPKPVEVVAIPREESYFPSISRIITEFPIISLVDRWVIVGFLSGILLMGILLVGIDLKANMGALSQIQAQRSVFAEEIRFWKGIIDKYTNYRDGYFKLALLYYQLGNSHESKRYLERALELDPNFKEGRIFEKQLGG